MDKKSYDQKNQRMEIAQRGGIPDRVPVYSLIDNWAFSYAGYGVEEVFEDDEKHLAAFEKIASDFYWDSMFASTTSRAMNYIGMLDGGSFKNKGLMQIESGHSLSMDANEYDDLIKDPYAFIRDVVAPRKYGLMRMDHSSEKVEKYQRAVSELYKFKDLNQRSEEQLKNKWSMPISRGATLVHPVDLLLDFFRDFHGIMMDVKRNPNKIIEAADAMIPIVIENCEMQYSENKEGMSIFNPMHLPQFLRPKDFEKVYWPSYKKIVEHFAAKGMVVQSYYERNYAHLYDFLQDLPKNSVFGLFEDDDLREVKKRVGDVISIGGGMEAYTLHYGTKQECIDMAKGLIDDLAPGGGYVFTTNRILHSANDANPENLKAVNEFVKEYGKYER
ncbi:hypothetical protein J0B03_03930 [Alkalibacter rhizosphaerae]|uniref:Uroporphyrinogen decarboxylase (URO-D) domain-containing protein n=1 Tax=Alkalibacter rhizosphaerae TaxID=2815577 RepID=A0A975AJ53_9FIRM|nr:uroporphyrinogen decarboxylase family protein [Alkalibacter rhizosphaerae]QSX09220.1 hypothetical protein J0B03_03930 [Alkalibacter rhizosphaerae]